MFKLKGIYKDLWMLSIPMGFYFFGSYLDRREDLRMTRYRDKSMLYGRELKPGEKPSWP